MGEGEGTCSSASPNLRFLVFPVSPFPQPAFHRAAQVALMGATYLYNEESTAVITGCLVFLTSLYQSLPGSLSAISFSSDGFSFDLNL